jgi:hypothetical protein
MWQDIHYPQNPRRTRTRELLFSILCAVRQSNKEANTAACRVCDVRQSIRQVSQRDTEEPGQQTLLFGRLLVCLQPARQSLSLGWWTERPHESRGAKVAQGCASSGQAALSDLSRSHPTRSTPHSPLRNTSRAALGRIQWHHALSFLPRWVTTSGNGTCRDTSIHGISADRGVAC